MTDRRKPPEMPAFFDATVSYDVSLADIVQAIKDRTGFQDGVVDFYITRSGKLQGATIKVRRTEIKG